MFIMLQNINQSYSKWQYTKKTSFLKGNIYALLPHNIKCAAKYGLRTFQAQEYKGQLWFKYMCYGAGDALKKGKKSYKDKTKYDEVDKNKFRSLHYLDRHRVQCKSGYSLNQVQLWRHPKYPRDMRIQYRFQCIETKCSKLVSYKSPTKNMGANELKFLPNLIVKTKYNHRVLTGFKFQRTKQNDFHYQINYCILDNKKGPKPALKPWKRPKSLPKLPKLPKSNEPAPTVAPLTPQADNAKAEGDKFCTTYCDINYNNRRRLCQVDTGRFGCKRCTIKKGIDCPEKRMVCEALCNGILPNNPCTFFGWLNNAVKDIDGGVLKKYGISLIRKK